ncbi:ribokinase [Kineothrix alysoides]|uniref:Ribokinase n=1 Tax=Kineothrix alysoides TaxID=1469948 RepID=A0A4V2QBV7_9FIRM|nr:ribokinase [Kineothrix alysoides]TCL57962.1 ribokinase [Kineothrix alysoides]
MKKKILVIGSLNVDMVIEMKNMPAVGETVLGTNLTYIPGGKGANQACAAAKLGGEVKMLGCIGEDEFGEIQKDNLSACGVDTIYFKRSKEKGTGTASIYVDERGNNSIVVVAGANKECDISYLQEHDDIIKACDYVILQMEIPYETIFYAVNRAKELGKVVIFNPAPAPEELPDEIFSKMDYITPNETELMKLCKREGTEIEDFIQGARMLLQKGVKNVLVTLGERGALLVNDEIAEIFPTRKVISVDTTAAGDCFNGALTVALAEGKGQKEAVIFANAASSIAVTRNGAQTSIPGREETDKVLTDMGI